MLKRICFPCWVSWALVTAHTHGKFILTRTVKWPPCSKQPSNAQWYKQFHKNTKWLQKSCIHRGRLNFPLDAYWHGNSLFYEVLLWLAELRWQLSRTTALQIVLKEQSSCRTWSFTKCWRRDKKFTQARSICSWNQGLRVWHSHAMQYESFLYIASNLLKKNL